MHFPPSCKLSYLPCENFLKLVDFGLFLPWQRKASKEGCWLFIRPCPQATIPAIYLLQTSQQSQLTGPFVCLCITGAAAGGILFSFVLLLFLCCCCCRRRPKATGSSGCNSSSSSQGGHASNLERHGSIVGFTTDSSSRQKLIMHSEGGGGVIRAGHHHSGHAHAHHHAPYMQMGSPTRPMRSSLSKHSRLGVDGIDYQGKDII